MSNAIQVLDLYRYAGTWVFDDEEHDLVKEPFVAGSPEILDYALLAVGYGDETRMRLLFSQGHFPESVEALRGSEEGEGYWYVVPAMPDETTLSGVKEGWLCPATLCYFDGFPEKIYFKVELIT